MTPKPDASPKSPAESLIEKLESRITESLTGSPDDYSEQCYRRAMREAVAVIRNHQAEQPQDVVERVARAIYKNNPATTNGSPMDWEYCSITFPERIYECIEDAEAAIAALGGGRAAIAPVSAETVQPITPASEAYQKVKQALEFAIASLGHTNCPVTKFDCEQALAALPSLMPVAPREISIAEELHKHVESQIMAGVDLKTDENGPWIVGTDMAATLVLEYLRPYLRQPSPPVDIEAGAIACSQWVYGENHGMPSWDRLSEEHRNEYREQAKACARAWGLKWKS